MSVTTKGDTTGSVGQSAAMIHRCPRPSADGLFAKTDETASSPVWVFERSRAIGIGVKGREEQESPSVNRRASSRGCACQGKKGGAAPKNGEMRSSSRRAGGPSRSAARPARWKFRRTLVAPRESRPSPRYNFRDIGSMAVVSLVENRRRFQSY